MKDSTTYQMIFQEGFEQGRWEIAKKVLFDVGTRRLGKPSKTVKTALSQIGDIAKLERLCVRTLQVKSWQGRINLTKVF